MPNFSDIDAMSEVKDYDAETLSRTAMRVAASAMPEHYIYRETELDELWRLSSMDLEKSRRAGLLDPRLEQIHRLIQQAHDVLGQDEDTASAAQLLRQAATLS